MNVLEQISELCDSKQHVGPVADSANQVHRKAERKNADGNPIRLHQTESGRAYLSKGPLESRSTHVGGAGMIHFLHSASLHRAVELFVAFGIVGLSLLRLWNRADMVTQLLKVSLSMFRALDQETTHQFFKWRLTF
jgi:hypothetical protein